MERGSSARERGFTVVELVVVIAIIGILAGIVIVQFRSSQASQEVERAAWELASDIRWMQQLSVNEAHTRLTNPPVYRYSLQLWAADFTPGDSGSPGGVINSYQVQDRNPIDGNMTVLKTLKLSDYRVTATVLNPSGAGSINITFYSYDVDRLVNGQLANAPYRVRLMHNVTGAARYVIVDSRVGRVLVTNDASKQPL